jgi:hypothetical protein
LRTDGVPARARRDQIAHSEVGLSLPMRVTTPFRTRWCSRWREPPQVRRVRARICVSPGAGAGQTTSAIWYHCKVRSATDLQRTLARFRKDRAIGPGAATTSRWCGVRSRSPSTRQSVLYEGLLKGRKATIASTGEASRGPRLKLSQKPSMPACRSFTHAQEGLRTASAVTGSYTPPLAVTMTDLPRPR